MIRKLANKEIDRKKWDECISSAANGLIYAKSFYLDRMSPGWDALVCGDYEAVMPLCRRGKWGFTYLYQPAFFQQGGIYHKNDVRNVSDNEFILNLPRHFSFAEITLNHQNKISETKGMEVISRMNFILDLSKDYGSISGGYSSSFMRNLTRIKEKGYLYSEGETPEEAIELYRRLYSKKQPGISGQDFRNFLEICRVMRSRGGLLIRKAKNKNGDLLALILLLKDGNRIYNMMSCLTAEGRKCEGNYFLYDRLFQELSGSPGQIFDFEGSDVPGIAEFYRRFNPSEEPYPFIRYNFLPYPFRWLKG